MNPPVVPELDEVAALPPIVLAPLAAPVPPAAGPAVLQDVTNIVGYRQKVKNLKRAAPDSVSEEHMVKALIREHEVTYISNNDIVMVNILFFY